MSRPSKVGTCTFPPHLSDEDKGQDGLRVVGAEWLGGHTRRQGREAAGSGHGHGHDHVAGGGGGGGGGQGAAGALRTERQRERPARCSRAWCHRAPCGVGDSREHKLDIGGPCRHPHRGELEDNHRIVGGACRHLPCWVVSWSVVVPSHQNATRVRRRPSPRRCTGRRASHWAPCVGGGFVRGRQLHSSELAVEAGGSEPMRKVTNGLVVPKNAAKIVGVVRECTAAIDITSAVGHALFQSFLAELVVYPAPVPGG